MTEVTETARPDPPRAPRRGMTWAARVAPDAGIAAEDATCRYKSAGPGGHACGEPAVLFVWRGISTRVKWNYCAADAARYGYWIEDGAVWHWVQVPIGGEPGA